MTLLRGHAPGWVSLLSILLLLTCCLPVVHGSGHKHHPNHHHLHRAHQERAGAVAVLQNATKPDNRSSIDAAAAASIIAQAHEAMTVANKLRLENVQYNRYEFLNSTSVKTGSMLAPPLDYTASTSNQTIYRRGDNTSTTYTNSSSYSYSIPSELAEAARIVAESSPPAPSSSNYAEVAARIKAKYRREVNDTNAMPQAHVEPDGLFQHTLDQTVSVDNITAQLQRRDSSEYWLANMDQRGYSPYSPPGYKIWRNVKDFGAKGDGITDDTKAIQRAVSEGGRCGANCGSSTIYPAVVWFPKGTYLVSSSIIQYFNTQFLGDPTDLPTILAAESFVGLGVISSDVYVADQVEWYVNQNNFLRSIRNFKIDITRTNPEASVCGIHWQVAQGTNLENIDFYMKKGTTQQGIYMENGSGGFLADLTFVGGHFGAYLGNQQFTSSHLVFVDCDVAMQIHWDWAWTMQDIIIESCDAGIIMVGGAGGAFSTGQSVGSLVLADVIIANTPTGIITSLYGENSTSLLLQNIGFFNVESAVVDDVKGKALLGGGDAVIKKSWGFGMFNDASGQSFFANGIDLPAMNRTGALFVSPASELLDNYFYTRRRPSYTNIGRSQIFDVKAYGAQGDGYADDTAALNSVFAIAANMSSVVYFPFGVYLIKDTLNIPVGSRIVGQAWAQIMATGPRFADADHPQVAIKIGQAGDIGSVEIQDMLFTVRGATAGLILVEWNVHQSSQGSAGLWDTHVRVGGAIGSELQKGDCPKQSGQLRPTCQAASLLMHFTPTSSAYLENVWVWVADHDLDVESQDQIDIFSGRGILVESQGPLWLYGTASEHSALYQYQFSKAQDVLMGMIQTESPYYQASPRAPAPFKAGAFSSDPTFTDCAHDSKTCAVSWAVRIIDSSNIYVLGAGLYSWFSDYSQKCLDTENCQDRGFQIEESYNIWLFNIVTKAIVEMISPTNLVPTYARDNKNGYCSSVLAWFRGADSHTGRRKFSGFSVYQQPWLDDLNLPATCKTALTQRILCDGAVQDFSEPSYRGSIENSTLYQEVCDVSCGSSLRSYYDTVSRACAGFNITNAPPTKVAGYLWEGWNETCYTEPSSGRFCNEIIDDFTEVDSINSMPLNEMCSYCYTTKYRLMQQSPYSAYDDQYQSDLEIINKKCGSNIPTAIPPPLVALRTEVETFCLSDIYHTTQKGDTCATIAKAYSVASYALVSGNRRSISNCTLIQTGMELCIPLPCDVYELQQDDLCITVQGEQGIRGAATLRTYNPWISSDCSNLQSDRAFSGGIVCISPQGGASTNVTSIRHGHVIPAIAIGTTVDASAAPAGAKIAAGTTTDCGRWRVIEEHDTCAAICVQEQINIDLFVAVNPSLGRDDCNAQLVTNTTVCVAPSGLWGSSRQD